MRLLAVVFIVLCSVVHAFAQARLPISKLPFVISKSGSYYVTKDLTMKTRPSGDHLGGIMITAENVDLDLSGHTLTVDESLDGSPSTKYVAVFVTSRKGISVRNGTIRGWLNGVNMAGNSSPSGPFRAENLTVVDCLGYGLVVYCDDIVVRGCTIRNIANGLSTDLRGLGVLVQNTRVLQATGQGIYVTGGASVVDNCQVTGTNITNTGTYGIYLGGNGVVERCYVEGCYIGILGAGSAGSVIRDNTIVGCASTFGGGLDGGGNH